MFSYYGEANSSINCGLLTLTIDKACTDMYSIMYMCNVFVLWIQYISPVQVV